MAFCVRSERKMEFQEKKTSIPGPGQYVKITPKSPINNMRCYPPFHSSSQRVSILNLNNVPGPGSYYLDSNYSTSVEQLNAQKKNNINEDEDNQIQDLIITNYNSNDKNNNNSLMTNIIGFNSSLTNASKYNSISSKQQMNKNKSSSSKDISSQKTKNYNKKLEIFFNNLEASLMSPYYYNNEKLGFLSQTIRFNKKIDFDNANTPGPGSYLESKKNVINETKSTPKSKNKILKTSSFAEKTGSLNRVVSIPSKIMNGYIYVDNNNKTNNKNNISFDHDVENNSFYNSKSLEATSSSKQNLFNNTFQTHSNLSMLTTNYKNNNCNKNLKLLINQKNIGKTEYNNSTSELVGPGSYDVSLLEKSNNIINWSKGFNLKKIKQKTELQKRQKLIEEMRKNGEFTIFNKKENKRIKKKIIPHENYSEIKLIKTNHLKNKIIDSPRITFIPNKTDIPGPGYYEKELIKPENDILKKKEKKYITDDVKNKIQDIKKVQYGTVEIKHSFGSSCERPINKCKSLEDLGPTTYFRQKNKYEPEKKNTIYKQLILGKTQMSCSVKKNFDFYFPETPNNKETNTEIINSNINDDKDTFHCKSITLKKDKNILNNIRMKTERKNNKAFKNTTSISFNKTQRLNPFYKNPGPGAYELSHTFIKPSFSSTQTMKNNIKRFSENDNGNPGPGSYQSLKTFEFGGKIILKKIFEKKYKSKYRDINKEIKIKNIIETNKKRNEVPGAGTYNIDKKNSIIYKIYSKFNPIQCYQSPFLNSSGRFMQYKNGNISPVSYNPYIHENDNKNNQYMLFNKANRFNYKLNDIKHKSWFLAGPGSYDLDPQWNKKSFNVLFSGNQ